MSSLATFWQRTSLVLLHLHALVNGSHTLFRQLHFIVLHPDLQPLFTNSSQLSGIRTTLFSRCRSPEALPPTSDAARLRNRRVRFQAMIWKQAHVTNPTLPLPESMGWSRLNDRGLHCSSQQQQHYIFCRCTSQRTSLSSHPGHHFLGFYRSRQHVKFFKLLPRCFLANGQQSRRLYRTLLLHERRE